VKASFCRTGVSIVLVIHIQTADRVDTALAIVRVCDSECYTADSAAYGVRTEVIDAWCYGGVLSVWLGVPARRLRDV
jgi:hypothetical protein